MTLTRQVDRWLLVTAYLLLFGFVAWMSWDLDRRAQQTQDAVCDTAYVQISSAIGIQSAVLSIVDLDSLEQDQRDSLLELTLEEVSLVDTLNELCGEPPEELTSLSEGD
jgi:hypothetical protein